MPAVILCFLTVIPCAVDGGAHADDGRALGDGGGVVVAHTHGQNIHLRPVVVLGIGLGQQLPHLRKKAARLRGPVGWFSYTSLKFQNIDFNRPLQKKSSKSLTL